MQDWRAILARNVSRLRRQKGLTQEELAFEAKIDLTYMGGLSQQAKPEPACDGQDCQGAVSSCQNY
jgi:hypothetical protein